MRYFRMVVYERVWLGLPVKGGGVTGGPVKQVMSVKEGKGMFFFSVSVFSGSLAWLGKVLCKCSGKYIDIYFNLKITYYRSLDVVKCNCWFEEKKRKKCLIDVMLKRADMKGIFLSIVIYY